MHNPNLPNIQMVLLPTVCYSIQKISAPPEGFAACLDSCKDLLLNRSFRFFLKFTISVYSILLQKQTPLVDTYLHEIDTDHVTYPTDACWRRTLIPMLSQIPCG